MNLRRSSVSGIRPRSLYVRSAPASSRAGRSSLNFFSRKVRTSSVVFDSTFGGVVNFSPTDFSIAGIAVATSFAYGPLPTGGSVWQAASTGSSAQANVAVAEVRRVIQPITRSRYQPMREEPKSSVKIAAGARNTPNGTSGVSKDAPRARARRRPTGYTNSRNTTAAKNAPTKIVRSERPGPSATPTIAISVVSPNPIASFLKTTSPSQPMIVTAPAPTHAPNRASAGDANGSCAPR